MVKPVIVKRQVKGTPLTYAELDQNFQNLDDATINFYGDIGDTRSMDLNDTTGIVGAHNLAVTVSESGQTITIDNQLHQYTREPMGFQNRTDSTFSFDPSTRIFTIQPAAGSFAFWVQGNQYTKTTAQTVTLPNVSDLYFIYFNTSGVLSYRTTPYDFATDCMVSAIQYNATTAAYYFMGEERHGVTMDWATHEYLNATQGLKYASGLNAVNYTTAGDGSANSHAQIDLTDGVLYQEDVKISIAHSNTPNYQLHQQDIAGPGRFPVTYHSGTTGQWIKDSATDYPVKYITSRIAYNLNTAGTWTAQEATNNHYVAMWLVGTSNLKDGPIVAVMGQREDSNIGNAQDNNVFSQLDLTNFPGTEARPLYRLIFQTGSYGNAVNARLVDIDDVRREEVVAVLGSTTAGLANVSDDLNPQLGGDLDLNSYKITNALGNCVIETASLYDIQLKTDTVRVGNATAAQIFALEGEDFVLGTLDTTPVTGYAGNITVETGQNGNIVLDPDGSGQIKLQTTTVSMSTGTASGLLTTPGTGSITIRPNSNTGASLTVQGSSTAGNVTLTPSGTGVINLAGPVNINSTAGTPTTYENGYYEDMLQTPVTWLKVQIGGVDYYLPLYQ